MIYTKLSREAIIVEANGVVEEWRNQFENPPAEPPVSFTINDADMLCANGVVLFPIHNFNPEALCFDVDSICVVDITGTEYEIGINWRVSGPPYMAFVHKRTSLYIAP